MKTIIRKTLAFTLSLALLLSVCALGASAASIKAGDTKKVLFNGTTFSFTPEQSGVYKLTADMPTGLFGTLLDMLFHTDPYLTVYDGKTVIGTLDDLYEDALSPWASYDVLDLYLSMIREVYPNLAGLETSLCDHAWVSSSYDGYLYLQAGKTYRFMCQSANGGWLCPHTVRVSFFAASADITFLPPEQTVYAVSKGEVITSFAPLYERYPNLQALFGSIEMIPEDPFYLTALSGESCRLDIRFSNGTTLSTDADNYNFADLQVEQSEETLGDCYIRVSLLGQTFTYNYTIVE